jgi:uncharacterized surface protein with fasciclin (FAS1) repeats
MKLRLSHVLLVAAAAAIPVTGFAQSAMSSPMGTMAMAPSSDPMVGGAAMYPSKNIVQNAVNSKDHTTLVAAVKAAGLVPTLEGPGPFTVFAPTNEAFDALPAGTVTTLLKPENKATLTKILTYHVVSGKYDTVDLKALIVKGNGTAMLPTVAGPELTFTMAGDVIEVTDAKGDSAFITVPDVNQSNGVIQVVNKVLIP